MEQVKYSSMDNKGIEITRAREEKILKKKVHRSLFEAREAIFRGDEEAARRIVHKVIKESAPLAYKASLSGGFNWVVEILKPLDDLFLPDE
ncbi:MAG: hypothetical protein FJ152_10325 [Firmicutes bacterium]|nr:hypothetical protein [Bacillota bacterium]